METHMEQDPVVNLKVPDKEDLKCLFMSLAVMEYRVRAEALQEGVPEQVEAKQVYDVVVDRLLETFKEDRVDLIRLSMVAIAEMAISVAVEVGASPTTIELAFERGLSRGLLAVEDFKQSVDCVEEDY